MIGRPGRKTRQTSSRSEENQEQCRKANSNWEKRLQTNLPHKDIESCHVEHLKRRVQVSDLEYEARHLL